MKSFSFIEATPLIKFIEENKKHIIGHTLKKFHTQYWPEHDTYHISDIPVVLELDDYCIVVHYLVTSDIELVIGQKEDLIKDPYVEHVVNLRHELPDYYHDFLNQGIPKELIENCKILDIHVERFSDAFEYNIAGDERPNGGDYFSTIRLCLDSDLKLCFYGEDAICDGYIRIWCE